MLQSCISNKIINSLNKRTVCVHLLVLALFTTDSFVLFSSTILDFFSTDLSKVVRERNFNCNARLDEAMASSNTPAVKRPGKARNKRLVQPVLPVLLALPQFISTRKIHDIDASQTDVAANGFTRESSGKEVRQVSPAPMLNLSNGVHKDEIRETSEKSTTLGTEASSAALSPTLQNGKSALTLEHSWSISGVQENI